MGHVAAYNASLRHAGALGVQIDAFQKALGCVQAQAVHALEGGHCLIRIERERQCHRIGRENLTLRIRVRG